MNPVASVPSTKTKGYVLLTVLFLMLFLAMVGLNVILILNTIHTGGITSGLSAKAEAIAQGGLHWALKLYGDSSHWEMISIFIDDSQMNLGDGFFQLDVLGEPTSVNVNLEITAFVPFKDKDIKRKIKVELTVDEDRGGVGYALFVSQYKQIDMVSSLNIYGDVYNGGDVIVNSTCEVHNGEICVPSVNAVSGAGSYTWRNIPGYPAPLPVLDTSYFDALIARYDISLDFVAPDDTIFVDGVIDLAGPPYNGLLQAGELLFKGPCIIKGAGVIAVHKQIKAHKFNLIVSPDAGQTIALVAGEKIQFNEKDPANVIHIERSVLYTQGGEGISITYDYATIQDSLIIVGLGGSFAMSRGSDVRDTDTFIQSATNLPEAFSLRNFPGNPITEYRGVVLVNNGSGYMEGHDGSLTYFAGLYYENGTGNVGFKGKYSIVDGALVCSHLYADKIQDMIVSYNEKTLPRFLPVKIKDIVDIRTVGQYRWQGE